MKKIISALIIGLCLVPFVGNCIVDSSAQSCCNTNQSSCCQQKCSIEKQNNENDIVVNKIIDLKSNIQCLYNIEISNDTNNKTINCTTVYTKTPQKILNILNYQRFSHTFTSKKDFC
ncbi:hypothetical protein ACFL56_00270 [Candidatus Margulisiibacteriota bacterium]